MAGSMNAPRQGSIFKITFRAGTSVSSIIYDLSSGYHGTFLVNTGSPVIAKTLQIVSDGRQMFTSTAEGAEVPRVPLFSVPITLAAGANAFSANQAREAGAVQNCTFTLNSAVDADTDIWLLWKS